MRVLVVEDNAELAAFIAGALRGGGFTVDAFDEIGLAEEALRMARYDLVVLDLMLPDGSGLDLLRRARRDGLSAAVLVLTALDGVADRVTGLDAGADDYLVKPFDSQELLARARALLRRASATLQREIAVGPLTIDMEGRTVRTGDGPLVLSRSEFLLLACFARNQDRVCSKEVLANAIYSFDQEWTDSGIELHVHRLRKKLADVPGGPAIKALRGLGYLMLVPEAGHGG